MKLKESITADLVQEVVYGPLMVDLVKPHLCSEIIDDILPFLSMLTYIRTV